MAIKSFTEKEAAGKHGSELWDHTCSFSCPECRRIIFVESWDCLGAKSFDVKCPHCETLFNKKWLFGN